MAPRSITLPFMNLFKLRSDPMLRSASAPNPEQALLIPEPKIGSKNYSEERLRADTGKYYQHVGRHIFR